MMGLKKRNKPKESTNVQIKLNVTVSDTEIVIHVILLIHY